MAEVVCLGEALIDFVALESGVGVGEASGFLRAPGGAPANVAVGVARLGRESAFLGKVGEDPFGRFLEQTFAGAGVDTGGMVFDPKHRTGLAFVSLAANGERDFCFFRNPSADMTYAPAELDRARIEAGRIFHYGSITLIDKTSRAATLAALTLAYSAGLLISYDPNLRLPLWPDEPTARKGILSAMRYADIVKVSAEELAFLVTKQPYNPDLRLDITDVSLHAQRLLKRYANLCLLVVTLGADGCFWLGHHGNTGRIAGFKVHAVDTTGAGDGFVAGMLVGLLERELAQAEALRHTTAAALYPIFTQANAVGALTTTQKGAIPALPIAAQVAAFRQQAEKQD
ncbi:MAG TPA: PfkB family carbohydrate kinase [Chthonomonadaceae bacterium]|nr:PfkB family carbohydrate kinase [Chthonomonadaceae bacterium]